MKVLELTSLTIFHQSPISTQIFSPSGESLMANKAWEDLWGLTHDQLGRYNVLKDKQLVKKGIMSYLKRGFKGEIVEIPAIKYEPDQTINVKGTVPYKWVKALIYPVKDENEKIVHVVLQHEDITNQKESEEEKTRSANILEHVTDSVIVTDLEGKITYWNKGAQKIFGYSDKEMLGNTPLSLYPELKGKDLAYDLEQILKGKDFVSEWKGKRKDGKIIWVDIKTTLIKDANGQPAGFIGIAKDITERKKADEAQSRLASIIESSDDAIVSKNLDGIITSWNPGAEKLFGYKATEAIGKHITLIIPKEFRKEEETIIKKIRIGEHLDHFETIRVRKDGRKINISLTISPIRDQKGVIIGASKIARDITESQRSKEALLMANNKLAIANARLNALVESNIVGIARGTKTGKVLEANDYYLKLLGFSRNDLKAGKVDWQKVTPPEYQYLGKRAVEELIQKGETTPYEKEYLTKDGARVWVLVGITKIPNSEEIMAFILDISEHKKLETQKDEFISIASHELKTPITSLKGYTQVLQTIFKRKGDAQSVSYFEKMDAQLNKLTGLVGDLLDVTKIESGRLQLHNEYVNFDELVSEMVDSLQLTTQKHTLIQEGKTKKRMRVDRDRVGQVLTNLISNAIKYSPHSDKVIIKSSVKGAYVKVCVQDFGVGIPKEKQDKVFERFFRVSGPNNQTFPGLGLGLYISSEIVKRLGGRIWVESTEGKGSTFCFTLPIIQKKSKHNNKII